MIEKLKSNKHSITIDISKKANSPLNIILAHGANNDMNYGLITKIFEHLKSKYFVVRFNFSYVDSGLKINDSINKNEIESCIRHLGNKNIVLIGKSYGGVLSTIIASEHKFNILKVIVLGYALHEPNHPNRIYSQEHLKGALLPISFIVGDSDPNCDLNALREIIPDYDIEVIKDADHSFRPTSNNATLAENEEKVLNKIDRIVEGLID